MRGSPTVRGMGMRRVDWVRIRVGTDRMRAEAVGVGFRAPATWPVPLSVAAELIRAGTRHVVCADGEPPEAAPRTGE